MAYIEPNFITQLLAKINIVDLIQGRVKLKKAGKNYHACCPFHQEKTPSFTVSEDKQFYHCFGCGEHGSALSFIMKYDNLSFPEAVEVLAQKTGTTMPQKSHRKKYQSDIDSYQLIEQCCQLFSEQLMESSTIQEYLQERQLNPDTIKKFRLGYAVNSWDALLKNFANEPKKIDVLKQLDMIIERHEEGKKQQRYDRFRNRLIFPILDRRGRAIAFGARVINAQDQPKYLNNSETHIFQKRREIYGLYQCLQAERSPEYLIITEGYMDVIALHQAGIPRAIASMGTALTIEQITQLFRYTKRLIICFDGDQAGKQASERALKTILPHIKEEWGLRFLLLPEGVDPDNYIKQYGKEGFINALKNDSMGVFDFIKHDLAQHGRIDNPEHKPLLAKQAKQWIGITAANTWQHSLINNLSEFLAIDSQYLIEDATPQNAPIQTHPPQRGWSAKQSRYAPQLSPSERFIIYALATPSIIQQLNESDIDLLSSLSPLINQLIQVILNSDLAQIPIGILIEDWRETQAYEELKRYLVWNSPLNEKEMAAEIQKIISNLQRERNKQEWEKLQQKMKLYGTGGLTAQEQQRYLALLTQRHQG